MPAEDQSTQDKAPFRPVLFVGLGSTGAKIVSRIKNKMQTNGDRFAKSFHRYLRITSETDPEPGVDPTIDAFVMASKNLATRDAVESFSKAMGKDAAEIQQTLAQWWYPHPGAGQEDDYSPWVPPVKGLDRGAGGVRPIGRMLLHSRSLQQQSKLTDLIKTIRNGLRNQREQLSDSDKQRVADKEPHCYVFGLLAGGTCSGTFLDVGYLLRTALPDSELHGVFLLGDICFEGADPSEVDQTKAATQRDNTRYALAEMFFAHNAGGREILRKNYVRRIGNELLDENAFDTDLYDTLTMMGAKNDNDHLLTNFDAYQEMIAEYFGCLYSTELHTRTIGRSIDEEAGKRLKLEESDPARPHKFRRVGMLVLRTPRQKIEALIKHAVANHLAIEAFKNAPEQGVDSAITQWKNTLGWGAFLDHFAPPDDGVLPESEEPLQANADDFRNFWSNLKGDIDTHYGRWDDASAPEPTATLESFLQAAAKAEGELLSYFLGTAPGVPFAMGGLKFSLKSLRDEVGTELKKLEAQQKTLEQNLYSSHGTSLSKSFDDTLKQAADDFPKGLLASLKRRSYTGDEDVETALRQYRDTLRNYVTAKLAARALRTLGDSLASTETARAIVCGRNGVEPELLRPANELNELFKEEKRRGLELEIITDRKDVERIFVRPILEGQSSPSDPSSRLQLAAARALTQWRSRSSGLFHDAFVDLINAIRTNPRASTEDRAMELDEIADRASDLQRGFRESLEAGLREVFEAPVSELSIWHAVERYTRMESGKPERVLQDLFKSRYEKAHLFPKLGKDAARDTYQARPKVFYLCNERDARECFDNLGIDDPTNYLSRLLQHVIGFKPGNLGDSETRDRLVLLLGSEGELPFFYQGFEAVRGLLANPPLTAGAGRDWTDKRFPEWIKAWHEAVDEMMQPQIPA